MTFNDVKTYWNNDLPKVQAILKLGSLTTIYNWKESGIPIAYQIDLELASKGKLLADLPRAVRRRKVA